jgi:hypothetical protein
MRGKQRGQTLVLAAMVIAFLFIPLGIYVIDSGLVEASYSQLSETLQASAEDGASMIDQTAYRESGARTIVLDPALARETADRSMRISRIPGLQSWWVQTNGRTVTVTAHLRVVLFGTGAVTLSESRSARLAYGQ